jgi:hypothetical protein
MKKEGVTMIENEDIKKIMKKNHAPGVQTAVINDFDVEWTNCYGFINANSKKRVNPDTIFEAGSTTKALTATTVLHVLIMENYRLIPLLTMYYIPGKFQIIL